MTAVDLVLLRFEHVEGLGCPDCGDATGHSLGCQWNQALSERGYLTAEDRDRARLSICPTDRPPVVSEP